MVNRAISFGREKEITREIGRGLEDSFKEAKAIDYQIAKTLSQGSGLMSYVGRIPIIGRAVTKVRAIKPLGALESELRTALNNSLISLVKVGKKANEESERIEQLDKIYSSAVSDDWSPQEFLSFIEDNTEIDYVVSLEGEQVDMKELFAEVDLRLSPERKKEKQREYLEWFEQHINLSRQYLESMHALCFVGCEWIGGMTRSYFDLTQLRGGMEEIQRSLQNFGKGGTASITSQRALRKYGTAYINGMRNLIQGYKQMCDLKDNGSAEFRASLQQLEAELNNSDYKEIEHKPQQKRLLSNPNKR